jgi:hypothetical protein
MRKVQSLTQGEPKLPRRKWHSTASNGLGAQQAANSRSHTLTPSKKSSIGVLSPRFNGEPSARRGFVVEWSRQLWACGRGRGRRAENAGRTVQAGAAVPIRGFQVRHMLPRGRSHGTRHSPWSRQGPVSRLNHQ